MKKKFWLILYHLGGSVVLLLLLYTYLQGLTTVTFMFSDTGIASKYYRGKI